MNGPALCPSSPPSAGDDDDDAMRTDVRPDAAGVPLLSLEGSSSALLSGARSREIGAGQSPNATLTKLVARATFMASNVLAD